MPQDLEQLLLARKVLDGSLGNETTLPNDPNASLYWDGIFNKNQPPKTFDQPDIVERRQPTGLEAKSTLFSNPNPLPYRPVETPQILEALKIIRKENPHAVVRMRGMHFMPLPEGMVGQQTGTKYRGGDFVLDPQQAVHFHKEDPVFSLIDAIRHEMSHNVGYHDDYESQPMLEDNQYGRRPLDKSGKARDAQDVDLASHLLHSRK